jgi:hypothetical protein
MNEDTVGIIAILGVIIVATMAIMSVVSYSYGLEEGKRRVLETQVQELKEQTKLDNKGNCHEK